MMTYVCGHRNPDTDSIVAAIAYASLQHMLGENDYIPVRLGHLNDETMSSVNNAIEVSFGLVEGSQSNQ